MNNSAELFKYTLAAGATQIVNATGTKLFVRTALQPFVVKFDTGAQIEIEDGFRYTSDKQFSRLQISNNNASDLYVEFYVSDATVERDAPLYIRDAITEVGVGSAVYTLLGSSASQVFPASPPGKHRKEVIIGNSHATKSLGITVGATPCGIIPPQSSFVLPTNNPFYITNAGAGAVDFYLIFLNYA